MANLTQGTVVAVDKCPDCGKPVQVKLNKNGNGYFTCKAQHGETFNICMAHRRWGKDASQKMQRAYIESRKTKEPQDEQPTFTTTADRRPAARVPEQSGEDERSEYERWRDG